MFTDNAYFLELVILNDKAWPKFNQRSDVDEDERGIAVVGSSSGSVIDDKCPAQGSV